MQAKDRQETTTATTMMMALVMKIVAMLKMLR